MFVYSVKSKYIKSVFAVLFIVITVISLFILSNDAKKANANVSINFSASNHVERMNFLSQFGWEVDETPVAVREISIPVEFDKVYNNYNEIQIKQGFDLKQYSGERVKRWTYKVKNYKGYENSDVIRANILISDGKVVGGDICSVEVNGFMHGFKKM